MSTSTSVASAGAFAKITSAAITSTKMRPSFASHLDTRCAGIFTFRLRFSCAYRWRNSDDQQDTANQSPYSPSLYTRDVKGEDVSQKMIEIRDIAFLRMVLSDPNPNRRDIERF
jgi:hypothetical protein